MLLPLSFLAGWMTMGALKKNAITDIMMEEMCERCKKRIMERIQEWKDEENGT